MSVTCAVIEAENSVERIAETCHICKCLIAAGRILDKDHLQDIAAQFKGLHAAKRGLNTGKRADCL